MRSSLVGLRVGGGVDGCKGCFFCFGLFVGLFDGCNSSCAGGAITTSFASFFFFILLFLLFFEIDGLIGDGGICCDSTVAVGNIIGVAPLKSSSSSSSESSLLTNICYNWFRIC
jgi:hypothetical protein